MTADPHKDFGPIAADYVFFETYATEAEQDVRAYMARLAGLAKAKGAVRWLDFGCGSGTFTARLFKAAGIPPERLELTLVEPVESARQQAVQRLAPFTRSPIAASASLTDIARGPFDLVLANHVFYYVSDLKGHVSRLIGGLSPTGLFLTALAGWTNALLEFWSTGFRLLGCKVPYHTSEDLEANLRELGVSYQKEQVPYDLAFPDSEENRMTIIRFLLADHLERIPPQPLLALFDKYSHAGRIEIRTACEHFAIGSGR
jgi:SAM-dependent methyltransferase